ncbi:MAG TPA: hypothetical protein VFI31_05485 [Pirellulales bacterium]|nr:hypothetical protein [Pirellulales bacterium]
MLFTGRFGPGNKRWMKDERINALMPMGKFIDRQGSLSAFAAESSRHFSVFVAQHRDNPGADITTRNRPALSHADFLV